MIDTKFHAYKSGILITIHYQWVVMLREAL